MGRRRGRGVQTEVPAVVLNEHGIRQVKVQKHEKAERVWSKWDESQPIETIIVPDAIVINIFPR